MPRRLVFCARAMAALALTLSLAVALTACSRDVKPLKTRWDAYYATPDTIVPNIQVVPPEGTTVPMAKLIAQYVVQNLNDRSIPARLGNGAPGRGRTLILTGMVEDNLTDPRVRYAKVMRWMLTDSAGRVIATHSHGVDAQQVEWDYGSARLLEAIGTESGSAVARLVMAETKATTPIDPLRSGLLMGTIGGIAPADADLLASALKDSLRTSDILITGDPRQAAFRLGGQVQTQPVAGGMLDVKIVWTVSTLDDREVGQTMQENRIPASDIQSGWGGLAPRVGEAAAVGVEHIFGLRPGPAPGAPERALGQPPRIVLPGEPGRAPPPPN